MFFSTAATPIAVVLDTNVVMDMLHFRDRRTGWLKDAIDTGVVRCFCDEQCLAELQRVVAYPEFALDSAEQDELMERYRGMVTRCDAAAQEPDLTLPRCRDADDQKFLELAARCGAALLVTRDKLLLRLAQHRRSPPPFAIVTAEAAEKLLCPATENPAQIV